MFCSDDNNNYHDDKNSREQQQQPQQQQHHRTNSLNSESSSTLSRKTITTRTTNRYYQPLSPTSTTYTRTTRHDDHHKHSSSSSTSSPVNPYEVLQIRRDATRSEIRDAYRRLALWFHPSRLSYHSTQPYSPLNVKQQQQHERYQMFQILGACYETLMDEKTRLRHDELYDAEEYHLSLEHPLLHKAPGLIHVGGKRVPKSPTSPFSFTTYGSAFTYDDQTTADYNNSTTTKKVSSTVIPLKDLPWWTSLGALLLGSNPLTQPKDDILRNLNSIPSLISGREDGLSSSSSTSSSYSSDEQEVLQSHDTNRIFGGHLSRMYRARNYEAFANPYEVFIQVFGSDIFRTRTTSSSTNISNLSGVTDNIKMERSSTVPPQYSTAAAAAAATPETTCRGEQEQENVVGYGRREMFSVGLVASPTMNTLLSNSTAVTCSSATMKATNNALALNNSKRASCWTGSTQKLPNGSILSRKVRTWSDRQMTRTENISFDPVTKQKHTKITVQGESLLDDTLDGDYGNGDLTHKSPFCGWSDLDCFVTKCTVVPCGGGGGWS